MDRERDRQLNDGLAALLRGLSEAGGGAFVFGQETTSEIGTDQLDTFRQVGLVTSHSAARSVTCPGCERQCLMPVRARETANGRAVFVVCDKPQDYGQVPLEPTALSRWRIDVETLSACLAEVLQPPVTPSAVVQDRLVAIGRCEIGPGEAHIFLLVGSDIPSSARTRFSGAPDPLVVCTAAPSDLPIPHAQLSDLLVFRDGRLRFLSDVAAEAVSDTRAYRFGNRFHRAADYWEIQFEGHQVRMKNTTGLAYIATLLAAPGREYRAAVLYAQVRGDGRQLLEAPVEASDQMSRAEIERHLGMLEGQRRDAEAAGATARAGELEASMENLRRQLARDFGKNGRPRREGDAGDKSRQAVQKAIRRTVDAIETPHPSLAAHLRAAIRTGYSCSYRPADPIKWQIIL